MARTVWRILRTSHDAEDALQNTLATVTQQWQKIQKHDNPQALILKICANCAYDRLRHRARNREATGFDQVVESVVSEQHGPAQTVENTENLAEVMNALRHLSKNQAVAIVMRFVQLESYEHIAAALGCAVVTARKHVARGRERLQRLLPHLTLGGGNAQENESTSVDVN
jgi:RNA polymerase sigma-70 factor (ECF subfamily)